MTLLALVTQAQQIDLGMAADYLTRTGAVGILALVCWGFVTGRVQSGEVVKTQIDSIQAITEAAMREALADCVKTAVREGFIDAWYELKSAGKANSDVP